MDRFFEKTENGFMIRLSLSLYARPAVIKALYKFHDDFLISYEVSEDNLLVFFQRRDETPFSIANCTAEIEKELDYQMIRYDTMKATSEIRQILVAKALYTTCIEPEKAEIQLTTEQTDSWKEDRKSIFKTWTDTVQ